MSDITLFKKYAVYRIGTGIGVPTVASGVTKASTVITSTIPFVDQDGAAISEEMLVTAKITTGERKGQLEVFKVPAGGVSVDGLTFTGCIRGIEPGGLDDASNSDFALDLPEGTILGISMTTLQATAICDVILGTLPTGARNFRLGDGTDNDMTIYAHNADVSKPFIQYDASANAWIISNDGSSSFTPGAGVGTISGGDGITVTSGVIDVDLDTDPGLEFDSGELRVKVKSNGGITRDSDGLSIDQANVKIQENVVVTATSTEINQVTDGVSANVTAVNLSTMTAGATSNADSLHAHRFNKKISIIRTSTTVSATTTETDLFTAVSIPGGTLGTTNGIKLTMNFSSFGLRNGFGTSITFRVKYGTTTVWSKVIADNSDIDFSTPGRGKIEVLIFANNSASIQEVWTSGKLVNSRGRTEPNTTDVLVILEDGAGGTENSANALNLVATVQYSDNNAANSITFHSGIIEAIQ